MASHIGRRKFLAALGGAAAAWPLVARAQSTSRVYRVGLLSAGEPIEYRWAHGKNGLTALHRSHLILRPVYP
jgi:hypothetical protein